MENIDNEIEFKVVLSGALFNHNAKPRAFSEGIGLISPTVTIKKSDVDKIITKLDKAIEEYATLDNNSEIKLDVKDILVKYRDMFTDLKNAILDVNVTDISNLVNKIHFFEYSDFLDDNKHIGLKELNDVLLKNDFKYESKNAISPVISTFKNDDQY